MANTLIPIQTYTLTSTASSVTFSNIPQNYTDLYLVISARVTRAVTSSTICLTFNGSATGYNQQTLTGNGSAASASSGSSQVNLTYMEVPGANATSNTFGNHGIYIPNYAGSSNKTISVDAVSETNATTTYMNLVAGLWSNTAAITSMTFNEPNGNSNFVSGSTFTLYGVSNGVKATGGTLTAAGGYAYHTFTSTGSFLPNQKITNAEILVIAGGGGAGRDNWSAAARRAGGGGAGGYRYVTSQSFTAGSSYTALVGAGGSGASGTDGTAVNGSAGSDSVFNNITSTGGGYGAGTKSSDGNGTAGGNGGSGGGGSGGQAGGTGISGQGNAGGQGWYDGVSVFAGGGGGGAVGVGADFYTNSPNSLNNAGGIGSSSASQWGAATGTGQLVNGTYYYAGGGGGGGGANGLGGYGGGGAGGGNAGTANTGGGGGGNRSANGGAGGSGLIIVRYPLS